MNHLRGVTWLCIFLFLLVMGVTSYALGQEETLILGRRGNVNDPNADILQVSFQLQSDKSLTILYVIEGKFVDKYSYGINLHAYEENRTFGNIVLGYYQQKQGVYYIDQSTARVKPLQYSIQGSTLKISGLTLSDIGDRYAFYASAQTVVEQNQQMVRVDSEPSEGARKIVFPSPSPEPTQTQPSPTTTATPTVQTTSRPATVTPQSSPFTTVLIIIAAVVLLSGLVMWRSSSRERASRNTVRRR